MSKLTKKPPLPLNTTIEDDSPSSSSSLPRKLMKPPPESSPKAPQLSPTKSTHSDSASLSKPHLERPLAPARVPSFSKRHASFDSPREVPLPSPNLLRAGGESSHAQPSYFDIARPVLGPSATPEQASSLGSSSTHRAEQVFPHPRPYSLPHSASSSSSGSSVSSTLDGLSPSNEGKDLYGGTAAKADRSSSASLPLPAQIPYHTLPHIHARKSSLAEEREREREETSESATQTSPFQDPQTPSNARPFKSPPPYKSSPSSFAPHPPSSFAHSGTIPNSYGIDDDSPVANGATAIRRSVTTKSHVPPPEPPQILPEPDMGGVAGGNITRTGSLGSPQQSTGQQTAASSSSLHKSSDSTSTVTPNTWKDPPPVLPPSPRPTSSASLCLSTNNGSDLPPVLPPQRNHVSSNANGSAGSNTPTSSGSSSNGSSGLGGVSRTQPPYAPFLSHMPPPADSWIEVQTTPQEYRLNVRLPGFKRDGITLATKRRRILHLIADSYEGGDSNSPPRGGHFERRISFGYDADLVGVRAEFDGEYLRVVVPRRPVGPGIGGGSYI
ncbi:hypothetical protein Moror_10263 [Moniliophthora roreri MCA 2997]|nr:hypothetical protein Moror_10263 [Moniliophthora roreri MCA 2997]